MFLTVPCVGVSISYVLLGFLQTHVFPLDVNDLGKDGLLTGILVLESEGVR